MSSIKGLDNRLRQPSLRFRFFGRSEIRELNHILEKDEHVHHCAFGFYQGGSGILVATNNRILLVDKRPFYLNIEDFRYEQISKTVLLTQFLQGTIYIQSRIKKLVFRSISDERLRNIKDFISGKVYEVQETRQMFDTVKSTTKPYLNPAWRPHHNTIMKHHRPTKFHTTI
jgi:hypothetical protein